VNLSLIIEEMQKLLEVSIAKRAVLNTRLARNLPVVVANAGHMRQIVLNLVINAAEAMEDKLGAIEIATSHTSLAAGPDAGFLATLMQGDYLRLEVTDNGRGIAKEMQAQIFDPFFTTKETGHGLGLSVVQGIVRRYGGTLDVQSVPNKGTRIEILLPAEMPNVRNGNG